MMQYNGLCFLLVWGFSTHTAKCSSLHASILGILQKVVRGPRLKHNCQGGRSCGQELVQCMPLAANTSTSKDGCRSVLGVGVENPTTTLESRFEGIWDKNYKCKWDMVH